MRERDLVLVEAQRFAGQHPRVTALTGVAPHETGTTRIRVQPTAVIVKLVFGPVSILIGVLTLYLFGHTSHEADVPGRFLGPLFAVALVGGACDRVGRDR